ncbi:MAG: TetR family transcriptional regulator [Micropruina sp.]
MPRKRRGRRPGREDTKAAIQSAALQLFSTQGYDKVSLRAIARESDVDPALIHHYFDSKADLFAAAVLDIPLEADHIVAEILLGPREHIGRASVHAFLTAYDSPGGRDRFTAMLRSAVSAEESRRPLSEFMSKEIFGRIAEGVGHHNHKLRGQLAVSLLLGLALSRYVLKSPTLVEARDSALVESIGGAMQHYLVDAW